MLWRIFVALALILVGVIVLLFNLQLLTGSPWSFIAAAILVLLGGLLVAAVRRDRQPPGVATESELRGEATDASLRLRHGAGTLQLQGSSDHSLLFAGTFGGGVAKKVTRENGKAAVELKTPPELWSRLDGSDARGVEWNLSLNREVAFALEYEGGAAQAKLDLTGLRLTTLELSNGASPVDVILPLPRGTLRIIVRPAAAPVTLRLPPGVPATMRGIQAKGLTEIDEARFPSRGFGVHQSDDYAAATDRIEVTIAGADVPVQIR